MPEQPRYYVCATLDGSRWYATASGPKAPGSYSVSLAHGFTSRKAALRTANDWANAGCPGQDRTPISVEVLTETQLMPQEG